MNQSTVRPGQNRSRLAGIIAIAAALASPYGLAMSPGRQFGQTDMRTAASDPAILWTLPDAWLQTETARALPGSDLRSRPPLTDALGLPLRVGSLLGARPFDPKAARHSGSGLLAIPTLEGSTARFLSADGDLILHFDRPVGSLMVDSPLNATVSTEDPERRIFRLQASHYDQGRAYPLRVQWQAVTGENLPPLQLEVTTPPPLTVRLNVEGVQNLGLMLPLQLIFSEPLQDHINAKRGVSVKTSDGGDVPGHWHWVGKQRLEFTPRPAWPASTTFEVRGDEKVLRAVRGGRLEAALDSRFSTGTDRRIYVYLDKQQAAAVENGQVVRTFKVSTGKPKTPTASGTFFIYDRYLHKTMRSRGIPKGRPGYYEVEDVPYTQFFKGDLALHGAFWHNGFGHPASHGCVNLATREKNKRWPNAPEDAGWLYGWAALGVPVTIYRESPVEIAVK